MQHSSDQAFDLRTDLQSFVAENCGCGVEILSDPTREACDDAELMLQQAAN